MIRGQAAALSNSKEKLIVAQLVKKFLLSYGIQIFITVFIRPNHLTGCTHLIIVPSTIRSPKCSLLHVLLYATFNSAMGTICPAH
jgi:hypothetical protein